MFKLYQNLFSFKKYYYKKIEKYIRSSDLGKAIIVIKGVKVKIFSFDQKKMKESHEHIILFVQTDESDNGCKIEKFYFTKEGSKYMIRHYSLEYTYERDEFASNKFDSNQLNFSYKTGNNSPPYNWLEWMLADKNLYEYNYGRIFKLRNKKKDDEYLDNKIKKNVLTYFTYQEIINYINLYENIKMGVFSNDYTKEYGNKIVTFIKVSDI